MKALLLLILFFIISCSVKKEIRYKETIATICNNERYDRTNPLAVGLISGSMVNTNDLIWSNYTFTVNGKQYWGEGYSGYSIGEKFIVKYDSTKLDNDHNRLIYYKPLFLNSEKTEITKGKIKIVHGKDRLNNGAIGITFEYCFLCKKCKAIKGTSTIDTNEIKVCYSRYQYLPPKTNIDSLKKNINQEYKVIYSIENPKRAIIYLGNN